MQRLQLPRFVVEKFVIDPRLTGAADAERNVAHDVIHDLFHRRRDLRALRVRQNGEVAAGDIEADTGKGNLVSVRDHATDRLRVTFVTIGAKNSALAAGRDTSFNLLNGRGVVLAKNLCRCSQTANYRPRHVPQSRACL